MPNEWSLVQYILYLRGAAITIVADVSVVKWLLSEGLLEWQRPEHAESDRARELPDPFASEHKLIAVAAHRDTTRPACLRIRHPQRTLASEEKNSWA